MYVNKRKFSTYILKWQSILLLLYKSYKLLYIVPLILIFFRLEKIKLIFNKLVSF